MQNALLAIASTVLSASKGESYHHSRLWPILKLLATGNFDGECVVIFISRSVIFDELAKQGESMSW